MTETRDIKERLCEQQDRCSFDSPITGPCERCRAEATAAAALASLRAERDEAVAALNANRAAHGRVCRELERLTSGERVEGWAWSHEVNDPDDPSITVYRSRTHPTVLEDERGFDVSVVPVTILHAPTDERSK